MFKWQSLLSSCKKFINTNILLYKGVGSLLELRGEQDTRYKMSMIYIDARSPGGRGGGGGTHPKFW